MILTPCQRKRRLSRVFTSPAHSSGNTVVKDLGLLAVNVNPLFGSIRKSLSMAEGELADSYAGRLKALHADSDLFQRLQDFVHDLVAFKTSKHARLRLLQEPTAEFYMSSAYFSPEQAHALLSFQRADGLTLEQALQAAVARKLQSARDGSAPDFELCTSHNLAPVLRDHFAMKKVAKEHRKNQRKLKAQRARGGLS